MRWRFWIALSLVSGVACLCAATSDAESSIPSFTARQLAADPREGWPTSGGSLSHPWSLRFDSSGNLDVVSNGGSTIQTYNGQPGAFLGTLASGLSNPEYLAGEPGNVIQGNLIGTNASGTAALPNGYGIMIATAAGPTIIGGTAAGAGNACEAADKKVLLGYGVKV